jgi:gluconate kinase
MGIVWVTGVSGTGKSAVCEALKALGHRALDADWDGFNHWVARATGETAVDPPYPVPAGWLDRYGWQIDVAKVEALAAERGTAPVFLCGAVENEHEVWECFERVVFLDADDDTLRSRLATRTTNEFGKHPDQLDAVLSWNQVLPDRYREAGATIVDATAPPTEVVNAVLAAVGLG